MLSFAEPIKGTVALESAGGNLRVRWPYWLQPLLTDPHMIASLLRLFALRPFLTMAILGIPVLVLIAVGLLTIIVMKLLVFVVLPVMAVIWLVRKLFRNEQRQPTA